MKLVFATNNQNKLKEIQHILGSDFELLGLKDIGCEEDIPETAPDLPGNALLKARYVKEKFGFDCFADDTGLEIEALDGEPGVYSARYAGEAKDANANMDKVLTKLDGVENRKACFKTVIALILRGEEHLFEGRVDGAILTERRGNEGFGYDPIFMAEGENQSFAEMDFSEKNKISHRARAVQKLVAFLCQ